MKNIILFDNDVREKLLPFTYTRPVGKLRVGILTVQEKWEKALKARVSFITQDYLSYKFPIHIEAENFVINGSVFPSYHLCALIEQLEFNEALMDDGELIAAKLNNKQFERLINEEEIEELKGFELLDTPFTKINHLWDLFRLNGEAIKADFEILTKGRDSKTWSSSNQVFGNGDFFVEEGVQMEACTLNTNDGPIYLGKNATIMEGSLIRGPFAVCEGGIVKMGAKIYGPTTIGPFSKVGGEINNCVFQGYSNKGHDGFLGNSVIGEWCNFGADSNNSNLKNNYGEVRVWDYETHTYEASGQQFCGLFMGDHSKCGINTMFNTGTVVGVFANVFGGGFPPKFIPSFSWGGESGMTSYEIEKAFEVARRVMARREVEFSQADKAILEHIYALTVPTPS